MPIIPGTLHGQFVYPGFEPYPKGNGFLTAEYTCSHGITPGIVSVTAALPLPAVAENADGVFSDNRNPPLVLKDLRVADFSPNASASGQFVTVYLEDRRWRWRNGEVNGVYNVPEDRRQLVQFVPVPGDPRGIPPELPPPKPGEEPIRPETKKTAPELIALLFKAMGERRYVVRGIDKEATPYTNWDAANPAQELQRLVESLGCRVIYRPADDTILIDKLGEGADLPGGAVLSASFSLKPKPRPSRVRLRGARKRWQMRFALEPVGEDFDHSWRLLKDLSYRPVGGDWSYEKPPLFGGVWAAGVNGLYPGDRLPEDGRALAQATVWRAYRIKETKANGQGRLVIPPDGIKKEDYKSRKQVRLLHQRLQLTVDDIGRYGVAGAAVYGRHTPPAYVGRGLNVIAAYEQTKKDTEVKVAFRVVEQYGIIVFDVPIVAWDDAAKKLKLPELVLECACEVTENGTGQFVRYASELAVPGGLDDRPHVFVKEDVEYKAVATYDANHNFKSLTDNAQLIKPRVAYHLLGELTTLLTEVGEQEEVPGVRADIQPDGAIQQVTYRVGGDPTATTHASRNSEHDNYQPNYLGRRQAEEASKFTRDREKEKLAQVKPLIQAGVDKVVAGTMDFFSFVGGKLGG